MQKRTSQQINAEWRQQAMFLGEQHHRLEMANKMIPKLHESMEKLDQEFNQVVAQEKQEAEEKQKTEAQEDESAKKGDLEMIEYKKAEK